MRKSAPIQMDPVRASAFYELADLISRLSRLEGRAELELRAESFEQSGQPVGDTRWCGALHWNLLNLALTAARARVMSVRRRPQRLSPTCLLGAPSSLEALRRVDGRAD